MKKIGIVGGIAWQSTVEYYRIICELCQQLNLENEANVQAVMPEMVIESLNIHKSFGLRGTPEDSDSWAGFDAYFNEALKRLEHSGAELAFIASNTPHNRFTPITEGISIPVVSLFQEVANTCSTLGVKKALVLGTAPTMTMGAYAKVLATQGIESLVPTAKTDFNRIVDVISALHAGNTESAAKEIEAVVQMASDQFADSSGAVLLACTELPLAFPDHVNDALFELDGVVYLNTTVIHAKAVFAQAIAGVYR